MLQKEFETRTKTNVTADQYEAINDIYMSCITLDKDEFCADWKKHGTSAIIADLVNAMKADQYNNRKFNEAMQRQLDNTTAKLNKALSLLLKLASGKAVVQNEIEDEVVNALGEKEYLKLKMQTGLPFNERDNELLLEILG